MQRKVDVFLRKERITKSVDITSTDKPGISLKVIEKWQSIIDLLAKVIGVPSGLIMEITRDSMRVFLKSSNQENPYEVGGSDQLGHGLYCETVIGTNSELLVTNALDDEVWRDNPDVKLCMISYYGLPIQWPDKEIFGTICVLDNRVNAYNSVFRKLIAEFKLSIEKDLELLKRDQERNKALTGIDILSGLIASKDSISDITDITLEYSKMLTGAEHGYVSVIDQKTGDNVSHTITQMMGKECQMSGEDNRIRFPPGPDGYYPSLWGHCLNTQRPFYSNSPGEHQSSTGIPQGHLPIQNFLSVPALVKGKAFGQIALANTQKGFSESDLNIVSQLAKLFAVAVERKEIEDKLIENEQILLTLFDNVEDALYVTDSETYDILYANPTAKRIWGRDIVGKRCFQALLNEKEPCSKCTNHLIFDKHLGKTITREFENKNDNRVYHIQEKAIRWPDGRMVRFTKASDITEEKRLQTQLQQAQKMESVGRLAGGVAHDYNNMLTIIIGYAESILDSLNHDNPLFEDVSEILNAGKRSSDITRQLLAFARQQTSTPKVLDLNRNLDGMLKMVRRLIGEDIDLVWLPAPNVWPVKVDPSQIDQILANLCVNARDSIKDVGQIIIETRNIRFDEDYCAEHAGFLPGEYVMIAVSDNGRGMAAEVLDKVFEPFFTTKGLEQGTGLGLSTVYGIIKQNNGFINVYSEVGKGTTIKSYLPKYSGQCIEEKLQEVHEIPLSRGETILMVEDDKSILKLGERMLKGLGYNVFCAASPGEAIEIVEENIKKINLLITDVVMPEMNGRELAELLQKKYSDLKALYMSGYTADVIAHRGVLDEGVFFIQKPLSKIELAVKIREALDIATN